MSDDTTQVLADLFDSQDTDATTEGSNTQNEQGDSTEEIDNSNDTPQQQRQKQIDAWAQKVITGKATLESIPANVAKWALTDIRNRAEELGGSKKAPEIDVEQIVEKKLAEKEDARNYETLKSQIASQRLTKEQQDVLANEFKELLDSGLPKSKALEKAIKISGINTKKMDTEISELRQAMSIPRTSNVSNTEVPQSDKDFWEQPEKDRMAAYKQMLNS